MTVCLIAKTRKQDFYAAIRKMESSYIVTCQPGCTCRGTAQPATPKGAI